MKHRLTITLSDEVLMRIDQLIDGKKIRNRSHAIETTLASSLEPKVCSAVILAGGRQSGKSTLLVEYEKKPLLDHIIDHLRDAGVVNIVIAAGKNNAQVKKEYMDGSSRGVVLSYVEEDNPLGTAGAVLQARKMVNGSSFLVIHGDTYADIDISQFLEFHKNEGSIATIAVKPAKSSLQYGKVLLSGNKITEFVEKDVDRGISIVNTGVYLLKPEIFQAIEENEKVFFESDIFPVLAREGHLSGYLFQGNWLDIGKSSKEI